MGVNIPSLLGLARGEACHAVSVAGDAVGSCPTLSPLPGAAAGFEQSLLLPCPT